MRRCVNIDSRCTSFVDRWLNSKYGKSICVSGLKKVSIFFFFLGKYESEIVILDVDIQRGQSLVFPPFRLRKKKILYFIKATYLRFLRNRIHGPRSYNILNAFI